MLKNRPYQILWIAIPVFILVSLTRIHSTLDLQIHDTFYTMASFDFAVLTSAVLGVSGLLYWLFRNKKLSRWITGIHVIGTLTGSSLLFFYILISDIMLAPTYEKLHILYYDGVNQLVTFAIGIWVISQMLFFINLSYGLIKK